MKNKYKIRIYFTVMVILWTFLMVLHAREQYHDYDKSILEIANREAELAYYKDSLYRKWGALNGGVYVPISEHTQPNPYLINIKNRDITTPDGQKLTLVNPAYMTRLVFEMAAGNVVQVHLTSDKYLNPVNKPDEWEMDALQKLYDGAEQVSELSKIKDKLYLRFMKPFVIDESCLKCHEYQGYSIGDIRGGISLELPLFGYYKALEEEQRHIIISSLTIWILGIITLIFTYFKMSSVVRKEENLNTYKTVLFREFNHRVKNNLQIITGIIDLYKLQDSGKNIEEALEEVQKKLKYMSDLHDIFTSKKDAVSVSAVEYINNICNSFSDASDKDSIKFDIAVDDFRLDNSIALTCGLIINELITNSYKYAFNSINVSPTIFISMRKEGCKVTLEYKDNGSGFTSEKKSSGSYGMLLVESMADKLNAKYTINGMNGFNARFDFNTKS